MGLSAETFRNIMQSLRSDAACGRNAEQRSEPRVGLRSRATILISHGNRISRRVVRVRDISLSGIGLVCDDPIAEGTAVLVHLPGLPASSIICRVVHCDELDGGVHRIGCHFETVIEPSGDAAALLPPANVG